MIPRSAGILIPLFSLRTEDDLGRGEIMQMKPMIDFALAMGHRVIQLLPVDETAPGDASPYSALSVFAIDPLYLSAGEMPGVGRLAIRRSRGNSGDARRPARARYVAIKHELLEQGWAWFASNARARERHALDDFIQEEAYWLADYSLFRALKERFGFRSWERWPSDIANREESALSAARRELAHDINKYCYFQFVAASQWRSIREYARDRGAYLGGDLAFSPGRDSDVVWAHREYYDLTRSIGTPPDAFSATGQRWGLPMPNWPRMQSDRFEICRARIRRACRLYDLIRIDHVIGLYRTFSFAAGPEAPGEFRPDSEDAQRAQGEAVIRAMLEEARGGQLIAEDLGTVPPWVRASLTAMGIPGYKVMQWERENWGTPQEAFIDPADYPQLSLAATGTHDTEALVVWWREQPIEERMKFVKSLRLEDRIELRAPLGIPALDAVIEKLYAAPSILTVLSIQDLFGWSARINNPGTVSDSNWSYRLPLSLQRMARSRAIRARQKSLYAIAIRAGRFNASAEMPAAS